MSQNLPFVGHVATRHQLVVILQSLNRCEEALSIAQDVARIKEEHPNLGPHHPSTLATAMWKPGFFTT